MLLNKKTIAFSLLSLVIGIICIYLVIDLTPITFESIYLKLKNINPAYIIAIATVIFINNNLIAYKWKKVVQHLSKQESKPQSFYLFYIVFAALVGILVPRQLSMLIVQSFATNVHKVSSVSSGFLSAIYNQLMNLLIPLLLVPPAILFAFNYISLKITLFLSLVIISIAPYVISKWQKPIVIFLLKIYYKIKKNRDRNKDIASEISILKPRFFIHLYWVTVLFHLSVIFKSYLVALSMGLNIKLWIFILGTPLIYLAMLLSITPGNLGIMEWSWIGILELYNVAPQDAASFAIIHRVLLTLSTVIIFTLVSSVVFIKKISQSGTEKT